ncbi:MAG: TIGR01212 family radical SAM protein [Candidatus Symbiothrix sp.]|jgi:radical SAM protein (TIGR01212 family)|nr:TIGR01212 family radical SAM protein [Candidatus Symbiothrix sp.]
MAQQENVIAGRIRNPLKWRDFGDFLKGIFPFKVQKISINAGFTCPNRDGSKGVGGCTYCNNQTFSPHYAADEKSVSQQLDEGIAFFSYKYPQMKYIAYFQAYTNTYMGANVGVQNFEPLQDKYLEALNHPGVVGLIIGTRPDCMPDGLLDELEKMSKTHFLLIEYGVESTDNQTLASINRGHTYEEAVDAIQRTAARGIYCGVHLILGLPGEDREKILSHADKIAQLPVTTVKLHQLQLIRGTKMAKQYIAHPGQFHRYEVDEYIDLCLDFIKRLPESFVIERFVSQSPKELLLLPGWGLKNYEFTARVQKRLNCALK